MKRLASHFQARVPAKINLSLAVTGKRGDLHTLDMILCPWDALADVATFSPKNSQRSRNFEEPRLELSDVKAHFDGFDPARFEKFFAPKADAIAKYFGVNGYLSLDMGIPLGAGLGGSSAATVATIKAIQKCLASQSLSFGISDEFLLSLGSDAPYMYVGGVCRVQGVGDIVTPLPSSKLPKAELFIPEFGSDSAACYAMYDKLLEQGKISRDSVVPTCVEEAVRALRNDLTLPATTLCPEIGELLEKLSTDGKRAMMSGSGSACLRLL